MSSEFKVHSYTELQQRIAALPPPKEGLVRVYRGQSHNYPLQPSGRRRKLPRAEIWSHYLRRLVMAIERSGPHDDDLNREFQIWMIWLQALAQHYGAGSNYLDVSHDLGVAVWFAFHKTKSAKLETIVGPPNIEGQDSTEKTEWLRFVPHEGPGYVYVLDLKPWNGEGIPQAGEIVDLKQAPEIFHSKRIEVQAGCLVLADEKQDLTEGNLVTEQPFEMVAGFAESPCGSWTVEQIFPSPAEDHWYARFLGLPFLLTPEENKEAMLQQSLPIMLFLSSKESPYVGEIRRQFRHLLPAHVYDGIQPMSQTTPGEWWAKLGPNEATIVALEGPQISAGPPVHNEMWNHDLLLTDWIDDVETYNLKNEPLQERVTLKNLIFEFSPLETPWYEGITPDEMLRAMWIVRGDEDQLAVYSIFQDYPGFRIAQAGPILLRLDPTTRRLQWRPPREDRPWKAIAELGLTGKAILSSLVLLRDLSPQMKLAPYPMMEADAGEPDLMSAVVPISEGDARLFLASGPDVRPWCVLRHADGEPYTTAKPNVGSMTFTSRTRFGQMPATELRQYLAKETEQKDESN